ncbi:ATP-binding protein [Thioalkalivibrio sp. ALE19]|uniref:ATP-binding protein n=1 Tax=Thioalkalivibrio sp. ALE19 TaxID=1266909 RepID=UPI00040154A6|nr:ATP-binding protein [Thioalkalivibrio sp. ALE19]
MAKRKIEVGSQLIYHTIVSQAGSFDKALLEFVMNSVDAEAASMSIEMDTNGFRVTDDGKGIQRIQDVETCLGTLGFEHDSTESRVFGKFGAGRSQCWSFAPTTMRTGSYRMDVDIKNWGLEYELLEDQEPVDGFLVTGQFYEPMSLSEVERTETNLSEMARYISMPVYFNGKRLNKPPENEKWTLETEQARIRLDQSSSLHVYNLGVLVCRYNSHEFGSGGVVVSNQPLQVNLARNAILESMCDVWKAIKKDIRKAVGNKPKKSKSLNDSEREYFLRQLKSGDMTLSDDGAEDLRLLQDVTGKRHRIGRLRNLQMVTFPPSREDERLAARVHEKGSAFVLHPQMLSMLGLSDPSPEEVQAALESIQYVTPGPCVGGPFHSAFQGRVESFDTFRDQFDAGHDLLDDRKDLSKVERCAIKAVRDISRRVASMFTRINGTPMNPRRIYFGVSETAEAWTDGETYIAIDREVVKELRRGYTGVVRVLNLLVHEYCHDSADLTGHSHSPEFFELYHEVTLSPSYGRMVQDLLKAYHNALKKAGLKPTKHMTDSFDLDLNVASIEDPEDRAIA